MRGFLQTNGEVVHVYCAMKVIAPYSDNIKTCQKSEFMHRKVPYGEIPFRLGRVDHCLSRNFVFITNVIPKVLKTSQCKQHLLVYVKLRIMCYHE